jgi:glycosyltransferase involved in cell wall biosynthesis
MNILFLTQVLPFPPDAGPKVKTWQVLRYLHDQGHKITLVSFVRAEEEKYLPEISKLGIQVYPVPMRRNRLMDIVYWVQSLLRGVPFLIERDNLPAMRALLHRLSSSEAFDVVHCDQLTMTQFAWNIKNPDAAKRPPIKVFDAHNATWKIVERMQENAWKVLSPILALESKKIKEYEGKIVREFEKTTAVTDIDRDLLLEAANMTADQDRARANCVESIPIAVDTSEMTPVRHVGGSLNIVTLGTLRYPPNADGIRWFIQKVLPTVVNDLPGVTLTVIGKNPPPDFLQYAEQAPKTIEVTGYVEDLTPYLERACLMVVPVRVGSGMRVRILEAFARGMPVVTTTVGLEGINARPEEDVLVADDPDSFARAVIRLAQDPELQARLSANGRRLAETQYDWQVVLSKLAAIYDRFEK